MPLHDQVTGCSQLPQGNTVDVLPTTSGMRVGPGFVSMSKDKVISNALRKMIVL